MHDFKRFPELTNSQLESSYFESPHKQVLNSFRAKVVKVTDGDTIKVKWVERDFDFPIRFADIAAPEIKVPGGKESQKWLENRILGEDVDIIIDYHNRIDKWGRLLGKVYHLGLNVGDESIFAGQSVEWHKIHEGVIRGLEHMVKLPKEWR